MLKETKEIKAQIISYQSLAGRLEDVSKLVHSMEGGVRRHKFRREQTVELAEHCRSLCASANHLDYLAAGNNLPVVG